MSQLLTNSHLSREEENKDSSGGASVDSHQRTCCKGWVGDVLPHFIFL